MWTAQFIDKSVSPGVWSMVIVVSLVAMAFDVKSRRVPNMLTGPILLAGLMFAAWSDGLAGLGNALAGCVILGLPYVLLFVFAGGGAGDAKLMGAIGVWLGLTNSVFVLMMVSLAGVVCALGYALFKRRLGIVLTHLAELAYCVLFLFSRCGGLEQARQLSPGRENMVTMPYCVPILIGVCLAAGGAML